MGDPRGKQVLGTVKGTEVSTILLLALSSTILEHWFGRTVPSSSALKITLQCALAPISHS